MINLSRLRCASACCYHIAYMNTSAEQGCSIPPAELQQILQKSKNVLFTWQNTPGWSVAFVSENVSRVFGYTAEDFLTNKITYEQCVHPDDVAQVKEEVSENFKNTAITEFEHQPYRIVTKEHDVRWVRD
jgi:PAS domain-containing protein